METLADRPQGATGRRRAVWLGAVAVVLVAVVAAVLVMVDGEDSALRLEDVPQGVSPRLVDGEPLFFVRDGDGLRVFLPDTRHLPEDTLWWCPNEQVFAGAKHGEHFGVDGLRLGGPSRGPLREYGVEIVDGRLVLQRRIVEILDPPVGVRPPALDQVDWSRPYNSGPGSFCDGAVSTPPR